MNKKVLAPIIVVGATWAARRTLATGYKLAFGHEPPSVEDAESTLLAAVAWAVTTAALIAVVDVLVNRALSPAEVSAAG